MPAPAGLDAGTASQLIRSVRRTPGERYNRRVGTRSLIGHDPGEPLMLRPATIFVLTFGAISTICCQGGGTDTGGTPAMPPMGVTPPTEVHDGVLDPHAVAQYKFVTASAGPADIRVGASVNVPPAPPPLFLTLRRGSCPDQCGDIVADSSNGSLAVQLAAGSYSLAVGNPNEQRLAFTLVMNYRR
jgi:hypothetical protein